MKLITLVSVLVILSSSLSSANTHCFSFKWLWKNGDDRVDLFLGDPMESNRWAGYTCCFDSSRDMHCHYSSTGDGSGPEGRTRSENVRCDGIEFSVDVGHYESSVSDHDYELDARKSEMKDLAFGNCTAVVDNATKSAEYKWARVIAGSRTSETGTKYVYDKRGHCRVVLGDRITFSITTRGYSLEECVDIFNTIHINKLYGDTVAFYLDKVPKENSLEESLADYNNALKIDKECATATRGKIRVLYDLGRYREIIGVFNNFFSKSSSDWHVYGLALEKLNLTDEAEYAFDQENYTKRWLPS